MGDVKRYDINAYLGEEGWMEEDRHGQYVEYTDYAKLEAALSSAPQGWKEVATMLLQARYGAHWQNIIEVHGADHYAVKLAQRLSSPAAPKSLASERQA